MCMPTENGRNNEFARIENDRNNELANLASYLPPTSLICHQRSKFSFLFIFSNSKHLNSARASLKSKHKLYCHNKIRLFSCHNISLFRVFIFYFISFSCFTLSSQFNFNFLFLMTKFSIDSAQISIYSIQITFTSPIHQTHLRHFRLAKLQPR